MKANDGQRTTLSSIQRCGCTKEKGGSTEPNKIDTGSRKVLLVGFIVRNRHKSFQRFTSQSISTEIGNLTSLLLTHRLFTQRLGLIQSCCILSKTTWIGLPANLSLFSERDTAFKESSWTSTSCSDFATRDESLETKVSHS